MSHVEGDGSKAGEKEKAAHEDDPEGATPGTSGDLHHEVVRADGS
jgi:hypothetical protein